MKKLFTIIAVVAMSLVAMAQTNQLVWSNGRLIYGTSIETIDSLTFGGMEDVDTLHLLLPRAHTINMSKFIIKNLACMIPLKCTLCQGHMQNLSRYFGCGQC